MTAPPAQPLILASASPRRRELLAALGVPFAVQPADADESIRPGEPAVDALQRIALRKLEAARAVAPPDATVLVADTDVVLDGRVLGKPVGTEGARAMLRALRARGHDVLTAVAVAAPAGHQLRLERTSVIMRDYADAEIEASIAAGTPFDKAGGYAIQDSALHPVERFDGCYCNVMGLPLWTAYALLRRVRPDLILACPDGTYDRCRACPLRQHA